jgi:5-methylcytosine-specific restriction endonuclease McrBC regulatory subunit McrC
VGEELKIPGARWIQGKGMTLDVAGRVRIKPDLSLWRSRACCFVGDVKYKVTELGEHEDLYQVLSYALAAGLPGALLIYASAARPADEHVVRNGGTTLHVRYIDLEATDTEILEGMAELAAVIRGMAASRELTAA